MASEYALDATFAAVIPSVLAAAADEGPLYALDATLAAVLPTAAAAPAAADEWSRAVASPNAINAPLAAVIPTAAAASLAAVDE